MHPLRKYLNELNEPVRDFAMRVGASRQTLYRIIMGSQAPRPDLARRIIEATGGAVSFEALYRAPQDKKPARGQLPEDNSDALLDLRRMKQALLIVVDRLAPEGPAFPEDAARRAAAAVLNTYAALSDITTRTERDLLRQAIRPVLEEILNKQMATQSETFLLERGAALTIDLYCQSWARCASGGGKR